MFSPQIKWFEESKRHLILGWFLFCFYFFLAVQVAIPAAGRRRVVLHQILSSLLFLGLQALRILYEWNVEKCSLQLSEQEVSSVYNIFNFYCFFLLFLPCPVYCTLSYVRLCVHTHRPVHPRCSKLSNLGNMGLYWTTFLLLWYGTFCGFCSSDILPTVKLHYRKLFPL